MTKKTYAGGAKPARLSPFCRKVRKRLFLNGSDPETSTGEKRHRQL